MMSIQTADEHGATRRLWRHEVRGRAVTRREPRARRLRSDSAHPVWISCLWMHCSLFKVKGSTNSRDMSSLLEAYPVCSVFLVYFWWGSSRAARAQACPGPLPRHSPSSVSGPQSLITAVDVDVIGSSSREGLMKAADPSPVQPFGQWGCV